MAELQVNVGAARFNVERLRARCGRASQVMLVSKSDFYGLGLDLAADLEASVDLFAVSSLEESLALESLTASKDIAVLYPPTPGQGLAKLLAGCLIHRRIVPTLLPTPAYAAQLRADLAGTPGSPLECYVLVPQTGDRFWSDASWPDVLADLLSRPELAVRGAFTHFAEAHLLDPVDVKGRIAEFLRDMHRRWPDLPLSVSDSFLAGQGQGTELAFCRVGLLPLAAVEPSAVAAYGLRTVLTLKARVINSYVLPRASRIGYCRRVLAGGTAAAILDIGFASGLPFEFFRHCSATAPDGRAYPFVETPWMEYSCILTGDELLPVGTEVELFGETQSVSVQAEHAGLPVEALFLHLSRVPRGIVER